MKRRTRSPALPPPPSQARYHAAFGAPPAAGECGGLAAPGGVMLARIVGSFITDVQIPGAVPIAGAATVLVLAAIVASLRPAARASRVDVVRALRAE
jgi:hypothetical protein